MSSCDHQEEILVRARSPSSLLIHVLPQHLGACSAMKVLDREGWAEESCLETRKPKGYGGKGTAQKMSRQFVRYLRQFPSLFSIATKRHKTS